MSEYTPGQWTVEKFTLVLSHKSRIRIADVNGRDAQERAANARLIAAAPDLYEALKGCVNEINLCDGDHKRVVFEAALNAILKAEGVDPENGTASVTQTMPDGENKTPPTEDASK